MESVVLVVHLIFALAIIGLVLLQRSEGGGLGIGGGGGLGGFASAKSTANALTKMTALCAAGFFVTSLTLGVLASRNAQQNVGLLENIDSVQTEVVAPSDDSEEAIQYIPPSTIERSLAPSMEATPAVDPGVVLPQEIKEDEEPIDNTVEIETQKIQSEKVEPSAPVE